MKILKEADKGINRILGQQKVEDKKYRRALWVIEDGNMLHNTLTGEVICFEGNEKEELISHYYLVPIEMDEVDFIVKWRSILQLALLPQRKNSYTILPTTACNARCFYCYEKGIAFHTMSDEMVEKVIEKISSEEKERATLRWFGGEPLVGMKQIDEICRGLKDKGIEVSSKMISNGYLFDEEVVDKAIKLWNLKKVQITLDGTEDVYNSVKAYISPVESPFKRVIRNISLLTNVGIKVVIRLNLGSHNYDDLKSLIEFLEEIKHENLSVYCKTLLQEKSEENDRRCAELMELLAEKGLREKGRPLAKLRINACMADNDNSIIIDPLGGFSKCEHHIFDGQVGNIKEGVDKEKTLTWKEDHISNRCKTCPLLPSCILLKCCPEADACSDFERDYRIQETKVTMCRLKENKKLAEIETEC